MCEFCSALFRQRCHQHGTASRLPSTPAISCVRKGIRCWGLKFWAATMYDAFIMLSVPIFALYYD